MKPFEIISLASEVAPFSKTGGLADVARSLPKSLHRLGHAVSIVTPLYKNIIDVQQHGLKKMYSDVPVHFYDNRELTVSYYRGYLMRGLPIYFVSCDKYFGRKKRPYGSAHENKRFYVFSAAALKLIELLGGSPDIIHCHDWHTGLVPELLKKQYKEHGGHGSAATVFTIHNLAFQLGSDWWEIPGPKRDNGLKALPDFGDDRHIERINCTKRGILNADIINTVSETYAEEILKRNFGQDLHRILKNRAHKLFGVVNGIDYDDFNPEKDKNLAVRYTYKKIHRKILNKRELQRAHGLMLDDRAFVVVMASRIAEQKGFDIVLPIVPALMKLNTQIIIMGDGNKDYIKQINKLIRGHPKRIALTPFADGRQETMLYAGGDTALFPSRFEPCGTGQLKSMRYGCVPVARQIGGLSDTVDDMNLDEKTGNGFVFENYDSESLLVAITRAYTHFQHRQSWRMLTVRDMKQSNSWELPARRYVDLYKKAISFKHENDHLG